MKEWLAKHISWYYPYKVDLGLISRTQNTREGADELKAWAKRTNTKYISVAPPEEPTVYLKFKNKSDIIAVKLGVKL